MDNSFEHKIYGEDGIAKKIVELRNSKNRLLDQRNELTKKIKEIDDEIKLYENGIISPNQYKMF